MNWPVTLAAMALVFAHTGSSIAVGQSEDETRMTLSGGAWHPGKLIPCADGFVTGVQPRMEEGSKTPRFSSGVAVEFRLPSVPRFLNNQPFATARVVHYGAEPGNRLMQSEQAGDRVQVCLYAFPTPTHDPDTGRVICDPNVDPRGIVYRVYDYKRKAAYMGPSTQHGCGGA